MGRPHAGGGAGLPADQLRDLFEGASERDARLCELEWQNYERDLREYHEGDGLERAEELSRREGISITQALNQLSPKEPPRKVVMVEQMDGTITKQVVNNRAPASPYDSSGADERSF